MQVAPSSRALPARGFVVIALAIALLVPSVSAGAGDQQTPEDQIRTLQNLVDANLAALELSRAFNGPVERVFLARTDVFADSMASGGLQVEGPLLLIPPDGIVPRFVFDEITRLGATQVTLLGGPAAIPPTTETQLAAAGLVVDRLFGPSRIETSAAIAAALLADATQPVSSALIVRAFGGPNGDQTQAVADSLAATVLAAMLGIPVLLTETDQLSTATADVLAESGISNVFVIGGEAAVGPGVVTDLQDLGLLVRRVAGPTRDDTAIAIAALVQELVGPLGGITLIDGTSPQAWVTAFAGAHAAARQVRPVLLSRGVIPANSTITYLEEEVAIPPGPDVLVSAVEAEGTGLVAQALGLGDPPDFRISPPPGALVTDGTPITIETDATVSQLGGSCLDGPLQEPGEDLRIVRQSGATDCRLFFVLEFGDVTTVEEVVWAFVNEGGLISGDQRGDGLGLVSGWQADISADGTAIVFFGRVAEQGDWGVYRRASTRIEGLGTYTRRIDVQPDGNAPSPNTTETGSGPRLSADGRYVVFQSRDPSLATDTDVPSTRGNRQTYVYDVSGSTMRAVSVDTDGAPVLDSLLGDISDDGRLAIYVGEGPIRRPGGQSGPITPQLWVHDLQTGTVTAQFPDHDFTQLDLSGDGTLAVVRTRQALTAADTNAHADTYLFEPESDVLELASVTAAGAALDANVQAPSESAHIGVADNGMVVFQSGDEDVAGQTDQTGEAPDVFLRDVFQGTTSLVSARDTRNTQLDGAITPDIASDGGLIAFQSFPHPEQFDGYFGSEFTNSCGIYVATLAGDISLVADPRETMDRFRACESSGVRVSDDGAVVHDTFERLSTDDADALLDVYLSSGELVTE